MGIWIVQQWSVRETDAGACQTALTAIADHIRDEHPEILGVRTEKQWVGSQAHRGFSWAEHYESLTAAETGTATQACVDVWKPVHDLTLPGTHSRSVWLDCEPTWDR